MTTKLIAEAAVVLVCITALRPSFANVNVISNYEAFTLWGDRCIGDCALVAGGFRKCYHTWHTQNSCISSKTLTTHFLSLNTEPCLSDCGNFGGWGHDWCAVNNGWEYCSRTIAQQGFITHETENKYATCIDDCDYHGYKYTWCNTGDGLWQYCKPEDTTLSFDFPTNSGTRCATRCKKYTSTEAYCYDTNHKWVRCFLNPLPQPRDFEHVSRMFNNECYMSASSEDGNTLLWCEKSGYRRKRQYHDLHFQCDMDVEDVIATYRLHHPTVTLRQFSPTNPIAVDPEPVLNYVVFPTYSYFEDERPQLDLPLALEAVVTRYTIDRRRQPFNTDTNDHHNSMDVNFHDPEGNYDERGHILAAVLGGGTRPYNLFPQARRFNRGHETLWTAVERAILRFVRENPATRYVHIWAALSYPSDNNQVLIHRPDGVMMRIRAYENNIPMDVMLGTPLYGAVNPYDNVYFSNNPRHSCAPLPQRPRNHRH